MPTDFQNANTVLNVSCVPSEGGQESIESYASMFMRARALARGVACGCVAYVGVRDRLHACMLAFVCLFACD